jgi:hypothetical protein
MDGVGVVGGVRLLGRGGGSDVLAGDTTCDVFRFFGTTRGLGKGTGNGKEKSRKECRMHAEK